ncbi:MAG TPA: SDR family NAD(P)-dependent oxidoreductase [Polyangiaceae bacterium]|nr:SDR family NAD(P)-dependent oxidoreductase [Polyangiaceae bacterium]
MTRTPPAALVTGASSGIGEAIAREYVRRGFRVALLARRLDRLEALAAELGPAALALACDVARDGELERAVGAALDRFGRLDVAVANAGVGGPSTFARSTLDDYRRVFETNVFGVLRTARACLGPLRQARGRFAVVGSVNGYVSLPGTSAYCASKHAVRSLAESLALEWRDEGVSVTHIAPGFVASEIRLMGSDGAPIEGAKDPVPAWLIMRAEVAARQAADAIEARRREAVITLHGKAVASLARHAPALVHAILRRAGRRINTRQGPAGSP